MKLGNISNDAQAGDNVTISPLSEISLALSTASSKLLTSIIFTSIPFSSFSLLNAFFIFSLVSPNKIRVFINL